MRQVKVPPILELATAFDEVFVHCLTESDMIGLGRRVPAVRLEALQPSELPLSIFLFAEARRPALPVLIAVVNEIAVAALPAALSFLAVNELHRRAPGLRVRTRRELATSATTMPIKEDGIVMTCPPADGFRSTSRR